MPQRLLSRHKNVKILLEEDLTMTVAHEQRNRQLRLFLEGRASRQPQGDLLQQPRPSLSSHRRSSLLRRSQLPRSYFPRFASPVPVPAFSPALPKGYDCRLQTPCSDAHPLGGGGGHFRGIAGAPDAPASLAALASPGGGGVAAVVVLPPWFGGSFLCRCAAAAVAARLVDLAS